MKTIVLMLAGWSVAAAACYGQVRGIEAGSAEARSRILEWQQTLAEQKEMLAKARESGQKLFGGDDRWAPGTGTLTHKALKDYSIGDSGRVTEIMRTASKVSDSSCLVTSCDGSVVFLLRGLDMSKVVDGVEFILQHPVVIETTYEYISVVGSTRTVLVLECDKAKVDAALTAAQKAVEDALFRQWSDLTGTFSVEARFVDFTKSQVVLERRDNRETIEVPMSRLSEEDQKWVRGELKRRLDEKQKPRKPRSR